MMAYTYLLSDRLMNRLKTFQKVSQVMCVKCGHDIPVGVYITSTYRGRYYHSECWDSLYNQC